MAGAVLQPFKAVRLFNPIHSSIPCPHTRRRGTVIGTQTKTNFLFPIVLSAVLLCACASTSFSRTRVNEGALLS